MCSICGLGVQGVPMGVDGVTFPTPFEGGLWMVHRDSSDHYFFLRMNFYMRFSTCTWDRLVYDWLETSKLNQLS